MPETMQDDSEDRTIIKLRRIDHDRYEVIYAHASDDLVKITRIYNTLRVLFQGEAEFITF